MSFPLDKVRIPAEKNGHTFTPEEITKLKQGEAVVCQFKTKVKEGQTPKNYQAPVQFNAAKMQLEFLFGERGKLAMDRHREMQKQNTNLEVPKTFRKQELTEKSRIELSAGGHGQGFRSKRQERQALPRICHVATRTEIPRLHVSKGL